jgi:hypothetical protein
MNANLELYSADGGYDSFCNHSDIWYHLGTKPIISYASNAVINQEGEEERITGSIKNGESVEMFMHQWKTNSNFYMRMRGKNR